MKMATKYAVYRGGFELHARSLRLSGEELERAAFDAAMMDSISLLGVYSTLFDAKEAAAGMECDLFWTSGPSGEFMAGGAVWVEEVDLGEDGEVDGIVDIAWIAPWTQGARAIFGGGDAEEASA